MVKMPAPPTVKAADCALVKIGVELAVPTVRVKLCVAGIPTPLVAVNVTGYGPALPAAGVPARRRRHRYP